MLFVRGVLNRRFSKVVCCALFLSSQTAFAQTAPDSGRLLQDQPKPPAPTTTSPAIISPSAPKDSFTTEGPRILVKGFRIRGAILIPEAELAAQLKEVVGKELTLGQLRGAASRLTAYYLQRGYLARAIVPPQEIKDGIVEIQIIEGRRGSLEIDSESSRISASSVQGFIDWRLARGEPMKLPSLGEALNILNEQPGVEAKAAMKPGRGEAEIDVAVRAAAKPLARYSLGANNYGSYGTGKNQFSGSITLNNPTGHLDVASLLVNASEGSRYVRGDYGIAAGVSGLRLGVNASRMTYQLTPTEFDALEAEGEATTAGLAASYPIRRHADFNLSLAGNYDYKQLKDRTVAGETNNRKVKVLTLGMDGYVGNRDAGDAVVSFGLNLSHGNSDQLNASALASDSTTRKVQGDFSKLGYNLGWLSRLPYAFSLNASLHGQVAGDNLDSSEQFSLGGPSGVRAYPGGEGAGDEGWLFSLNLGKRFGDNLSTYLFYDMGGIRLNHTLWSNWNVSNPDLPNTYTLRGAGVGADWRVSPPVLLSASVAAPIGSNPGADINDLNVDGKANKTRAWLKLSAEF